MEKWRDQNCRLNKIGGPRLYLSPKPSKPLGMYKYNNVC